MARKTTVVLEDDLDGGPASHGISFALEGVDYEIDLNDSNAAKLRDALAPYVAAGRRTGGRRQQAAPAVRGNRAKYLSDVRGWARANGHEVADRGRVSKAVVDAYAAANG